MLGKAKPLPSSSTEGRKTGIWLELVYNITVLKKVHLIYCESCSQGKSSFGSPPPPPLLELHKL